MTRLVDEAAAVLGLQLSGTMITRLKICYEHATGAVQPDRKVAIATSTTESADAEAEKGPSLGERLLAKGLVSGCSTGSCVGRGWHGACSHEVTGERRWRRHSLHSRPSTRKPGALKRPNA